MMHDLLVMVARCMFCLLDPPNRSDVEVVEVDPYVRVYLETPAVLQCYAMGWPRPSVTWWRGDRILPLSSKRYEQRRDFTLLLAAVGIEDLGPYTCQAYNGLGKARSWTVTVQAYRSPGGVYAASEYLLDPPVPQQPAAGLPYPRQPYIPAAQPTAVVRGKKRGLKSEIKVISD
jgi:Immunoglobulin I-set domain